MKRLLLVIILTTFITSCVNSPTMTIKEFLLADTTDRNEYINGEYVCRDFALDVVHNARKEGFKAYLFSVHWEGTTNETHAIVAFEKSKEFVYADVTQTDSWVIINFSTGEYTSFDIHTGEVIIKTYIDWWYLDTGK